jgi:HSP20 family molecular chaperone IbpA
MSPEKEKKQPGDETIELVTSLWNGDKKYHIIAEIPGISEEKIQIDLEQNHLVISALDSGQRYKKEILLSGGARLCAKKCENGILHLTLDKIET